MKTFESIREYFEHPINKSQKEWAFELILSKGSSVGTWTDQDWLSLVLMLSNVTTPDQTPLECQNEKGWTILRQNQSVMLMWKKNPDQQEWTVGGKKNLISHEYRGRNQSEIEWKEAQSFENVVTFLTALRRQKSLGNTPELECLNQIKQNLVQLQSYLKFELKYNKSDWKKWSKVSETKIDNQFLEIQSALNMHAKKERQGQEGEYWKLLIKNQEKRVQEQSELWNQIGHTFWGEDFKVALEQKTWIEAVDWMLKKESSNELELKYDETRIDLARSLKLKNNWNKGENQGWWAAMKETLKGWGWSDKTIEFWYKKVSEMSPQGRQLWVKEWCSQEGEWSRAQTIRQWGDWIQWGIKERQAEAYWQVLMIGRNFKLAVEEKSLHHDEGWIKKSDIEGLEKVIGESMYSNDVLREWHDLEQSLKALWRMLQEPKVLGWENLESALEEKKAWIKKREYVLKALTGALKESGAQAGMGAKITEVCDFIGKSEVGIWNRLPDKVTWNQLIRLSDEWHDLINSRKNQHYNDRWESRVEISTNEVLGRRCHALVSGKALYEEGKAMHHCVSSYASKALSGNCRIFAVEKAIEFNAEGAPTHWKKEGTLELARVKKLNEEGKEEVCWNAVQFRGVCNAAITEENAWKFVKEIAEQYTKLEQEAMKKDNEKRVKKETAHGV